VRLGKVGEQSAAWRRAPAPHDNAATNRQSDDATVIAEKKVSLLDLPPWIWTTAVAGIVLLVTQLLGSDSVATGLTAMGCLAALVGCVLRLELHRRDKTHEMSTMALLGLAFGSLAFLASAIVIIVSSNPTSVIAMGLLLGGIVVQLLSSIQVAVFRYKEELTDILASAIVAITTVGLVTWSVPVNHLVRDGRVEQNWSVAALAMIALTSLSFVLARRPAARSAAPLGDRAVVVAFGALLVKSAAAALTIVTIEVPIGVMPAASMAAGAAWILAALHRRVRDIDKLEVDPTRQKSAPIVVSVCVVFLQLLLLTKVVDSESVPGVAVPTAAAITASLGGLYLLWLSYERAKESRRAYFDGLTGLPNRVLFGIRLDAAIAEAQRTRKCVGLLFFDLDKFKHVNDTYGHEVGNKLLKHVARSVNGNLRAHDTLARWAGDEFIIVLPNLTNPDEATEVGKRILEQSTGSVILDKKEIFPSYSIGVSVYPQDGLDAQTLQDNADAALYLAKERGRRRVETFNQQMSEDNQGRLALESALHTAIERNELELWYQPKVDALSGRIVALEALMRWHHPELGWIKPDEFIPIAEETGLIEQIGEWALWRACSQMRAIENAGLGQLSMAINVSPRQFIGGDLVGLVERVLHNTGIDPRRVELEITEQLAVKSEDSTLIILDRLSTLGIGLSLDDFGTGFSSISYLTRWPIDHIKIDKSFVSKLTPRSPTSETAIVDAILALAQTLRLHVTAEGVESYDQASMLRDKGCDFLQGYCFAKPLPAAELARLLSLEVRENGPITTDQNRHVHRSSATRQLANEILSAERAEQARLKAQVQAAYASQRP
jgi:diguanylate cyclase (GGDEF)-like protein